MQQWVYRLALAGLVVVSGCTGLGGVDRKYNRFTDETRILLNPMPIRVQASDATAAPKLTLEAFFTSPGLITVQRPQAVTLALQSTAPDWRFDEHHELTVWLNGESLKIGTLGHDGTTRSGYRVEYLWAQVPVETFMRIAAAKQVVGQVGDYRFELDAETLAKLQDFANRIPEPPLR